MAKLKFGDWIPVVEMRRVREETDDGPRDWVQVVVRGREAHSPVDVSSEETLIIEAVENGLDLLCTTRRKDA